MTQQAGLGMQAPRDSKYQDYLASNIGGIGLIADALNERALAFYRQYGFVSFRDDPLRVVLVLKPTQ